LVNNKQLAAKLKNTKTALRINIETIMNNMDDIDFITFEKIKKAVFRTGHFLKEKFHGKDDSIYDELGDNYGGNKSLRIDLLAEDEFIHNLNTMGVSGRVISEERGEIELQNKSEREVTIILDPLDGSSNYKRRIPFSVVSAAIIPTENIEEATFKGLKNGIIYDFWRNTMYELRESQALVNGNPMVTIVDNNASPIISLYTYKSEMYKLVFEFERRALIRCLGSAALELTYVALGALNAYMDVRFKLKTYDFAVGAKFIDNLGGNVLIFRKGEVIPHDEVYLPEITKGYGMIAANRLDVYDLILSDVKEPFRIMV